ncbi:MAG TPA: hypothetical protein VM938_00395 [Acidimicrobiales bacterium]|nr:hypothetical protein [Acidimicrobiales bacterium]
MLPRLFAVGLAALALAGCGRDDPAAVPSTTAADLTDQPVVAAVPLPPSSTLVPKPHLEPDADIAGLADGRHAAYVKSVDVGARTVTVDVIEFLTGEEAVLASVGDGKGSEVPDDYYIRNHNARLRTLPLAPGAEVRVLDVLDPARSVAADADALVQLVATGSPTPYWLTVAGGRVAKVEQQYLP